MSSLADLPSMIQEGSIGDGFSFAPTAAVSINARDIDDLVTRSPPIRRAQNNLPALPGKQGSLLSLIPTIKVKCGTVRRPQSDAGSVLRGAVIAYAMPMP